MLESKGTSLNTLAAVNNFHFTSFSTRALAYVLAMAATFVLFVIGFYPSVMKTPASIDKKPGNKTLLTLPTETPQEEVIHTASSKTPTPETKVSMVTQMEVKVPVPEIKVDFSVNPQIDVGVEAPQMPQIASTANPVAPSSFSLSELDNQPSVLFAPNPIYPSEAKREKKEGTVMVRVVIDPQGRVLKADVLPGKDTKLFGSVTLKAVRNWRFKPAEKNGQKVMCWVDIPVRFRLNR